MTSSNIHKRLINPGRPLLFAVFFMFCTLVAESVSSARTPFDTARIYHAMAKARRGEPITIGVIGGSITAGSLATAEDKRWANIVANWWREQFPSSAVTLVNAGIGATGSDIGTFRIQQDILQKNPDFVIVEFAVNDSGEDSHYVREMMEGIVRQLLADSGKTGIMLLLLKMENGGTAQDDHKVIADYYKIPWVSQADLIGPTLEKDRLTLSQVYGDTPNGVHPNDLGMQYIADFIINVLGSIRAHLPADQALPEINLSLPAPLVSDVFSHTYTYTAGTLTPLVNTGWSAGAVQWTSDTPGAELAFQIDGNAIAVKYDKKFDDIRGRAEVWVDDGPHLVIDAFFTETWGTKPCFQLVAEGLPDGRHNLHSKILEEHDSLSNGNYVQILSVYKAGNIGSTAPVAVPEQQKDTDGSSFSDR
jgi:lysophospholipase L1-like esterase